MNKSVKATLLSALVCPGAGHFSLKLYARGLIFMLPFLTGVYYLLQSAMEKANAVLAMLEQSGVMLDETELTQIIETAGKVDADRFTLLYTAIGLIWLLAMADAYWQSRKTETRSA